MERENINPYAAPQSAAVPFRVDPSSEAPNAGRGRRFLHMVFDQAVVLAVAFLFSLFVGLLVVTGILPPMKWHPLMEPFSIPTFLYMSTCSFAYYTCFEGAFGRSLGKWLTDTQVVTETGRRLTLGDAALRSLSRLVHFEAFSFFGKDERGWHDKWTGTRVVDLRGRPMAKIDG
jgi:uncharacterized RDD family membrane protein YckC